MIYLLFDRIIVRSINADLNSPKVLIANPHFWAVGDQLELSMGELCPKVVRGVKSRGYLVVKLLCLNPVFELYTFYHFPKLPESSQPAPVVLRTNTQLEHHAQHPLSA